MVGKRVGASSSAAKSGPPAHRSVHRVFLLQPNQPNKPRPVAKSGSVAGAGTAAGVGSSSVGARVAESMLDAPLPRLNAAGIPITEGELGRALRDCGIETSTAADRLKTEVKAFYNARKDRRIKIGDRPPLHDTLTGGRSPGR